jgi:hypothetical protein
MSAITACVTAPWVGPFLGGVVAFILFDYVPKDSREYASIIGSVVGFAFFVVASSRVNPKKRKAKKR